MNYIPFSTGRTLQLDVNVSGLAGIDRLFTSLGFELTGFPPMLSHQLEWTCRLFDRVWLAISTFPQGLLLVLRINTSLSFLADVGIPTKL